MFSWFKGQSQIELEKKKNKLRKLRESIQVLRELKDQPNPRESEVESALTAILTPPVLVILENKRGHLHEEVSDLEQSRETSLETYRMHRFSGPHY